MSAQSPIKSIEADFFQFLEEISSKGSNTPPSYVQAIHILNTVFKATRPELLAPTGNLWLITNGEQLAAIRKVILNEVKKLTAASFRVRINGREVIGRTTSVLRLSEHLLNFRCFNYAREKCSISVSIPAILPN